MVRNVGFVEAITLGLKNYFNFKDRAQRSEYWWFILFTAIASVVAYGIDLVAGTDNITSAASELDKTGLFETLVSLALFIPSLSIAARRLHDIGKSGWWQALPIGAAVVAGFALGWSGEVNAIVLIAGMVTLATLMFVIYWLVLDSDRGENRFGPSPKYQGAEADDTVAI